MKKTTSKLKYFFFASLLSLLTFDLNAQCPVPPSCTPGGPTNSNAELFSMGIRRVTLNTLDKTSSFINSPLSNSYHDYSCTDSTTLVEGTPYTITVNTNGNPPLNTSNENVRVWLDLNNDSSFSATELIFSSNNQQTHTGNVILPSGAVYNTPLRMRVAAEWVGANNAIPTPCGDREYSEVEDYKITVQQNLQVPATDFTADPLISCDGIVQFQDLSVNGPNSWLWDFGDGNFSTLQNPTHTYTSNDTFDVTLIASNANGSDTLVKNDYIIRTGFIPPAAACTPLTNAYCCAYGVTNFSLQDINNSSADASVGYQDFTCTDFTRLTEGFSYPFSMTTNPNSPESVKIYLDLNANGSFQDPGELLYSESSVTNPSGNLIIPSAAAPFSQPLRLRVMTDAIGTSFNSCTNLTRGQAEDYTVILEPNPLPPVANFSDDQVNSCQDTIQFTDNSLNAPVSWFWDFGDGNTSTLQNPLHGYAVNGTYTVKLVVTNNNGSDSVTQSYTVSDGARAPVCIPNTLQTFFPLGIERVVFNTINNVTSSQPGFPPYEDFACDFVTTVSQGQTLSMTVESQSNFTPSDVKAWLDYNDNGIFEASEEILNSTNQITHTGIVTISSSSSVVTGKGLRLRVASEFVNSLNGPIPCGNLEFGQTEDYTVIINAPSLPPVADFTPSSFSACTGEIEFTDNSGFAPNSWFWDFGDGNTSTQQNPTHTYTAVGSYFVELTACNSFGCDSVQKVISITSLDGVKPISCIPTSNAVNGNIGIFNVTLNDLNVSTNSLNAYQDFSCDKSAELVEGNAYNLSVDVGVFNNHTVEAWIDFNNSGTFTSNEKIYSENGFGTISNVIVVPPSAVKNQFLRMRVIANSTASGNGPFDPCNDIPNGEIEDYSVMIRTANAVPTADFEASPTQSCNGEIAFINKSYSNPTNYLWDFGDGTTSNLENPVHRYQNPGAYTVKLRVQNGFGSDSITRSNYIAVSQVQGPKQANCYPGTQFSNPDFGLVATNLASINNNNSVVDGYENYTCSDTAHLRIGQNYSISFQTSPSIRGSIVAFLDYNNDGIFQDPNERIFLSNNRLVNHSGSFTVQSTDSVNRLLRMRVWVDMASSNFPPGNIACTAPEYGQVEDYGIVIEGAGSLEENIKTEISLFPNPASESLSLRINSQDKSKGTIHIYNNLGVLVLSREVRNELETIDIQNISSGIYILHYSNKEFQKTLKFIKE